MRQLPFETLLKLCLQMELVDSINVQFSCTLEGGAATGHRMRHEFGIKFCSLCYVIWSHSVTHRQNPHSEMWVHTTNKIGFAAINACFLPNPATCGSTSLSLAWKMNLLAPSGGNILEEATASMATRVLSCDMIPEGPSCWNFSHPSQPSQIMFPKLKPKLNQDRWLVPSSENSLTEASSEICVSVDRRDLELSLDSWQWWAGAE